MADLIFNERVDLDIVGKAVEIAGADTVSLGSCSLGLSSINFTPTRASVLADFTAGEVGYDGYARKALTWNGASRLEDGTIGAVGATDEFRPTGATTASTVYVVFAVAAGGADWCFAYVIDDGPKQMNDTHDAINPQVVFKADGSGVGLETAIPV